jgi:hypothetical protein
LKGNQCIATGMPCVAAAEIQKKLQAVTRHLLCAKRERERARERESGGGCRVMSIYLKMIKEKSKSDHDTIR